MSSAESSHRLEIEILGQRLVLRSAAPPDYVRELVAYVEEIVKRLRSPGGTEDPTRLALLAALMVTDELFQSREDRVRAELETLNRVNGLLRLLDEAAPPSQLSP